MAKERSEASKYHSRYSEGWVSASQYIVELICEKKARLANKDLPVRFWKLKEWASFFRSQIGTANKLLKKYDEKAIIRALKDKKAFRIYSLRAPHLLPIIESEQKKVVLEQQSVATVIPEIDTTAKPRPKYDPLKSLRNLDG